MAKAQPKRRQAPKASEAPAKKPIAKWVGYGVVGALVVALVAVMFNTPEEVPEGIPEGAEAVAVGDVRHVEGPIDYDRAVPAGGPHNAIPLDCGVYDFEIPQENAVHSLEHAAVWITYRPEIGDDAIGTLESVARTRAKTILSPVPDQPSPIMATAWGWQIQLDDPDDIRLRQFVQSLEGAGSAPEPGAACVGGVAPRGA